MSSPRPADDPLPADSSSPTADLAGRVRSGPDSPAPVDPGRVDGQPVDGQPVDREPVDGAPGVWPQPASEDGRGVPLSLLDFLA